jgi:non-heme chloroperoxidase
VKAFVCIDSTPKYVATEEGDWSFAKEDDFNAIKGEMVGVAFDRRQMMRRFIGSMVTREVTEEEMSWLLDEVMKTPNHAALELEVDGMFADYSAEAKMIDGKIPVLNVLSDADGWTEPAKAWLATNAPSSETFVQTSLDVLGVSRRIQCCPRRIFRGREIGVLATRMAAVAAESCFHSELPGMPE